MSTAVEEKKNPVFLHFSPLISFVKSELK